MTWIADAACADHDLPASAWTEKPFSKQWGKDYHGRKALRVCAACPVAANCLRAALKFEAGEQAAFRSGIWGGTTPQQRAHLRQRLAVAR